MNFKITLKDAILQASELNTWDEANAKTLNPAEALAYIEEKRKNGDVR
jgi:hypothetical protein